MTHSITPDGLEEILYNFALTLLRTRQTIEPVGSITFAEAKTAINQYMLDTFMELIDSQYELSIADLELRNYQDGVETPALSKTQLRKAAHEKLNPTVTPKTEKRNTDLKIDVPATVTSQEKP